MITAIALESELKKLLNVKAFDFDIALNGIQAFSREKQAITHLATAVDATGDVIKQAVGLGANCLLTHHGICWGNTISGQNISKRNYLEDNNCYLMSYHLPLDSHIKFGNNARLANYFGVDFIQPFGEMPNNTFIGVKGLIDIFNFPSIFNKPLIGRIKHPFSHDMSVLHSNSTVAIAIVSGAGGDYIQQAIDQNITVFVTGECRYQDALFLKDNSPLTVEFLGHHASETLGVRALGDLIAKNTGIKVTHIDAPIYL